MMLYKIVNIKVLRGICIKRLKKTKITSGIFHSKLRNKGPFIFHWRKMWHLYTLYIISMFWELCFEVCLMYFTIKWIITWILTYFEVSECFINGRDMVETVLSVWVNKTNTLQYQIWYSECEKKDVKKEFR